MAMKAMYYFAVDGLWVEQASLGRVLEVEFEGQTFWLEIPRTSGAFAPEVDIAWVQVEGPRGEEARAEVIVLKVSANLTSDVLASEYDPQKDHELVEEIAAVWQRAQTFVARLLEWSAVKLAQSQHAPAARVAPDSAGLTRILDRSGDRIPLSWSPPFTVSWRGNVPLLEPAVLQEICDLVSGEERPATARQLLADAEFHAWHAADRRFGIALVLAAIACEMAVKTLLRTKCSDDQVELVSLVIENPRDVSLAAISLFDKGLAAVHERSLRAEDKDLYKALELLFQHRNRFAHGRELGLSHSEVAVDLVAARRALDYLEAIEVSAGEIPAHD